MIRNFKYGVTKNKGLYTYVGGGSEFLANGYYFELGEMIDLGTLSLSIGVGNAYIRDHSTLYPKIYMNQIMAQIGAGVNF